MSLNNMLYDSEWCCVHVWDQQPTLRNHTGDQLNLTTQTKWNMCHTAPAYNFWNLQTFCSPLSFSHQNNRPILCGQHQRQRVSHFTTLWFYSNCQEIHYNCRHQRLFLSLVVFFSSLIQRWMSPNLLVTHCLCRLISEAYLLRKLKNLCRGAAASLS